MQLKITQAAPYPGHAVREAREGEGGLDNEAIVVILVRGGG